MFSLINGYDFGYGWGWNAGHLLAAAVFGGGAALAWLRFRAPRTAMVLAVGAVWGLAAFLVVQLGFRFDAPVKLPTPGFLESGAGRVLDIGSGSGRSTVMVLNERPRAQVVALDNWSADYIEGNSPRLLLENAAVAGGADRVETATADMRELPFGDSSFDGIVSTYAIDHLDREGSKQALAEARRVLAPGGTFLLEVMNSDGWVAFTYGPLAPMHGFRDVRETWRSLVVEAGFEIVEEGRVPGTAYYLLRRGSDAGPPS